MNETFKRFLISVPFVQQFYSSIKSRQEKEEAYRLFVNPELLYKNLEEKGAGNVVLETRDGLTITIRQNYWDAKIVKEVFIERPYTRNFDLPANPTIVDIGGYIGDFSIFAARYLDAHKVVVYEPVIENFTVLQQNIINNGYEDRIIAVNKAVSDSSEVLLNVQLYEYGEIQASAYYSSGEYRKIPGATLSDILSDNQLDSVDLLKVDCEGCEYDIFTNVGDDVLQRIQNIVFEYHAGTGFEERLERLLSRLQFAGYSLQWDEKYVYAARG